MGSDARQPPDPKAAFWAATSPNRQKWRACRLSTACVAMPPRYLQSLGFSVLHPRSPQRIAVSRKFRPVPPTAHPETCRLLMTEITGAALGNFAYGAPSALTDAQGTGPGLASSQGRRSMGADLRVEVRCDLVRPDPGVTAKAVPRRPPTPAFPDRVPVE